MDSDLPSPIAIDGPAASGKSTVGRALASELGYRFLDTGLMYRAFALAALRARVLPRDTAACERLARKLRLEIRNPDSTGVFLDDEDVTARLQDPDVEAAVSSFSQIAGVRTVMVELQRDIAASGRSVLAGRDIGTVVLPKAPLKFYLDASEDARAARRSAQSGRQTEAARENVALRDHTDSTRAVSPLMPADDAIVLNTTDMTLAEVVAEVVTRVHGRVQ